MKKMTAAALIAGLGFGGFAQTGPAKAAPMTLACDLVATTTRATRFIEADQFVFDLEDQSVSIRAAKTIGTEAPVDWLFTNRTDMFGEDHFVLSRRGSDIVGAGIYGSNPVAIRLRSDGALTWVFVDLEGTPQTMRWGCQK
ncbi:hypothetical protein [Kaistia terrae]|uniref:Uncharacterized protein n=1 Tax=Kaistia terrae TaxID=537017 RepID=A0ABW0PZL8_9HYPH|nr:hypothetical protein [Kaistia terrae]MCX5578967.1 hypothetical protein [Kaistia terrae]